MLCTGAIFVKKNSCLVARIVSFDTVGLHLLTFRILEPCSLKGILILRHYQSTFLFESILQSFPAAKL